MLTVFAHKMEVCGLTLHHNTVASSGNDGRISIWDLRNSKIYHSLKLFSGGVKAIQWCPWKVGQLVAAGGIKDHKVILWNSNTDCVERTIDAVSQVTAIRLREGKREMVSTHGRGVALIWDMEKGKHKRILKGHKGRVLGLA